MVMVRKTLEDIQNTPPNTEILKRLDAMGDEDIDFSDMPELTEADFARAVPASEFWQQHKLAQQMGCAVVIVSKSTLAQFQHKAEQTGGNYQQMIDEALQAYLISH